VGGLWCAVIHAKCHRNRLRGYGAVGVENGPSPLLLHAAYTTACTTVQALIRVRVIGVDVLAVQGKFVRIHFGTNGKIAGADIESCELFLDWLLCQVVFNLFPIMSN